MVQLTHNHAVGDADDDNEVLVVSSLQWLGGDGIVLID